MEKILTSWSSGKRSTGLYILRTLGRQSSVFLLISHIMVSEQSSKGRINRLHFNKHWSVRFISSRKIQYKCASPWHKDMKKYLWVLSPLIITDLVTVSSCSRFFGMNRKQRKVFISLGQQPSSTGLSLFFRNTGLLLSIFVTLLCLDICLSS